MIAFCEHWRSLTGTDPGLLVFDQKLTTQAVLAELDQRGVTFMTLRMRSPALIRHIDALDPKAWTTVRLDRDGNYRKPQVVDETVRLSDYPNPIRQLVVRGLGRESPTVIITNHTTATPKFLIERYARRMTIEQRLAEAIRSFHLDSLSSSVPLNVDLDVVLSVLASSDLRRAPPTPPRLPHRHPRHPPTTLPPNRRRHPHHRRHDHRPTRPPRLLTRPALSRPPRHHRPLVGRPPPPPRIRGKVGPISLRENAVNCTGHQPGSGDQRPERRSRTR